MLSTSDYLEKSLPKAEVHVDSGPRHFLALRDVRVSCEWDAHEKWFKTAHLFNLIKLHDLFNLSILKSCAVTTSLLNDV